MTKSNISQYDATASNNTDIDGTDIAENCSPAGINNAIRSLMSHLKQMDVGTVALTSPKVTGDFTVDTTTLHVDSTNNRVGIGTSSPAQLLSVEQSSTGTVDTLVKNTGIGASANARVMSFVSGASGGDPSIGLGITGVQDYFWRIDNSDSDKLKLDSNGTTRMTIDSSGNLLVGHTGSIFNNINATSTVGTSYSANGEIFACSSQSSGVMILNRKTTDGTIATFRKDGTTVGSIGVANKGGIERLYIGSEYTGLYFRDQSNAITPANPNGNGTDRDNAIDLGFSSVRFDDIYATNGTIQTSDRNEKENIAPMSDAEITAAKAIGKLFRTFKWKDAVAEKGDAARTHTGVIAQDVQQAMTDAGLDAGNYAFFISSTWWETQTEVPAVEADEESGIEAVDAYTRTDTYETADAAPEGATERTRLGVRYPELLAFVGAATEQRLADIETRLTALEG